MGDSLWNRKKIADMIWSILYNAISLHHKAINGNNKWMILWSWAVVRQPTVFLFYATIPYLSRGAWRSFILCRMPHNCLVWQKKSRWSGFLLILHFNWGKIVQIFENQYGFSVLLLLDIYRHLFICKICRIFAVENSNMDNSLEI